VAARYRGLRAGEMVSNVDAQSPGLLVKPGVARLQFDADRAVSESVRVEKPGQKAAEGGTASTATDAGRPPVGRPSAPPIAAQPKRFHGTARLENARAPAAMPAELPAR
jgi:hypothetical protein